MRKLILIILFFGSIINIANAIPIPALAIGYEFLLFAIPSILGFFSITFLYFRKYLLKINSFLFITGIILYFIHFSITDEIFYIDLEYFLFILILGIGIISYRSRFLHYILVLFLIGINFFLINIDYNLYEFKQIYNNVEKNMYSNIEITDVLYKDNFMVLYGFDIENKVKARVVIEKGLSDLIYHLKKGKYYIAHSGDIELGSLLANLAYGAIK
ncbi:MAG: hypothetical protein QM490_04030 [Candidatus Gracilibacteria bacterium]